jgi:hypothetical protein
MHKPPTARAELSYQQSFVSPLRTQTKQIAQDAAVFRNESVALLEASNRSTEELHVFKEIVRKTASSRES